MSHAVKLLIAAESNSGKTTLTKTLDDTLVISHDGKRFPFSIPHSNIEHFDSASDLTNTVNEKIETYHEKFGEYPKTVVFDSVSRIFDSFMDNCNNKFTGYKVYSNLNQQVYEFTSYIEDTLIASDINVVLLSHAIYDTETSRYNLIGKGDFQKRGGFLAEVDESVFIEVKSTKRNIHFKSNKFPARTLHEELPESMPVEEFNLQEHLKELVNNRSSAVASEI